MRDLRLFVRAVMLAMLGETTRYFSIRKPKHLATDRTSHIFKKLKNPEKCNNSCSPDSYSVLDHATTGFKLDIKEGSSHTMGTTELCLRQFKALKLRHLVFHFLFYNASQPCILFLNLKNNRTVELLEAGWPSGLRSRISIRSSRVQIPLWSLPNVALGSSLLHLLSHTYAYLI